MTEVVIPRAAVPEVGQIVTVRGANWAVVDVQQQGLGRSTADDATAQLQHAVALQSVQEDRLGHELRVVWELEQGRSALAHRGLPEEIDPARFDDPNRLAAFIDALRWGAITSADDGTVQAPFRSGANVEPYQLTPLKRAPGQTLACCFDPRKALCRKDTAPARPASTPDLTACDHRCANIARTDEHITTVEEELAELRTELDSPATPEPMRHRIRAQIDRREAIVTAHRYAQDGGQP